ncbi:hypothetical protein FGO68_gene6711 [Halteria grandinella]|uniref:Uncharacterized protein n=1 Tax=Halteria grandinella TaxID=5974 RepID=A0A8J8SYL4_HALGN|nr:hypothetical protein FGO68_gene6711 [Halteria grandinella]
MEGPILDIKIMLIGASSSGKTSLRKRFFRDTFTLLHEPTVGCDFDLRKEKGSKLQMWDHRGGETFWNYTKRVLHRFDAFVFVFSVAERHTFEYMQKLIRDIQECQGKDKCKLIVGNKVDKKDAREVSFEEAQMLAQEHGMGYTEASALDGFNVQECFDQLIRDLTEEQMSKKGQAVNLIDTSDTEKKCSICC